MQILKDCCDSTVASARVAGSKDETFPRKSLNAMIVPENRELFGATQFVVGRRLPEKAQSGDDWGTRRSRDKVNGRVGEPLLYTCSQNVFHRMDVAVTHATTLECRKSNASRQGVGATLMKVKLSLGRCLAPRAERQNRILNYRLLKTAFGQRLLIVDKFKMRNLMLWR
jgi:hypothetical protein